MTFAIPSLPDLVERARRAFRGALPGSDAWLWPNNIGPSAKVMGGLTHEVFGFADYIAKQKFALTAEGENLDMHGAELGLARRPATPSQGQAVFTAPAALTVDPGAILRRGDGVQFRVVAGGSLPSAGTLTLDIASTGTGKATMTLPGTTLSAVSGLIGAATIEVGAAGVVGGADVEKDGDPFTSDLGTFRGRILFRKRNVPQGGSAADYVMWAGEVPGVTGVFVERRWSGPGTVRVFPLMHDLFESGVPDAANVQRVAEHIDVLAPAGAVVTVVAPVPRVIDVTIDGLVPATTAVQEAVLAELKAAFRRQGRVAGIDVLSPSMPYLAASATFSRSWIWQAVANASGEERHSIAAPAGDIGLVPGEYPVLGAVAFT
ncbi:baseplate J/gp47 family protein [Chelatococcus sp. XZ-Ab1]|uniref:baseplate J/gp47 family protein n=1 Tax=Chelatococcus sp. XZ-Ab1 TaxID=3034027 RepID=UPI0023E3914D|nr:baseplate J/gp47 family protein [Chelatococcus sp. XZ-Ab1]